MGRDYNLPRSPSGIYHLPRRHSIQTRANAVTGPRDTREPSRPRSSASRFASGNIRSLDTSPISQMGLGPPRISESAMRVSHRIAVLSPRSLSASPARCPRPRVVPSRRSSPYGRFRSVPAEPCRTPVVLGAMCDDGMTAWRDTAQCGVHDAARWHRTCRRKTPASFERRLRDGSDGWGRTPHEASQFASMYSGRPNVRLLPRSCHR